MSSVPVINRPSDFIKIVQSHIDGVATVDETSFLNQHQRAWEQTLYRLLDQAEDDLDYARRSLQGAERALVVADFRSECDRIDNVLTELVGPAPEPTAAPPKNKPAKREKETGEYQLHLSWLPGRLIAWAGGNQLVPESTDLVSKRLKDAGVAAEEWEPYQTVRMPNGAKAESLAAPIGEVLGWLVAHPNSEDGTLGVSVKWLSLAAAVAVDAVAQGRMVPQLKRARRAANSGNEQNSFEVRWTPALLDPELFEELSSSMPGAVSALDSRRDAKTFTEAVIADLVDAICQSAASRLEVPAPPPAPRTKSEISEAFLARLDGTSFAAPARTGSDLGRRMGQWAKPVTGVSGPKLVIQLDPPDDVNSWYVSVLAQPDSKGLQPVETAIVNSVKSRSVEIKDQLTRLERLYPPLLRPGGRRRGEVLLSQDEAWQLMSDVGEVLIAAGFDLRVPTLSRKKSAPALRLTSESAEETSVGAQQLADVSWSAVFGEVELTAAEISELASDARPLVESNGRWIELNKVDLAQAAAALADRADKTRLSGADMLRHALGLEGTPLAGGVSISGLGWAADLLRSAQEIPEDLPTSPDGFEGDLRSYQADALAWLGFLDSAGLGGCLALDMGLGKTPTMLAHIGLTTHLGSALVIAPPAVVGNWAAEAKRFVPGVKVKIHHGPSRASADEIPEIAEKFDLIITTYGTAIRDVEALSKIEWNKVVLDEAQAIKNPASETAQKLRLLNAKTRVALTGTPIENGLGDLWAIADFTNPGLVGNRSAFIAQLSPSGSGKDGAEGALKALNGILVFRRTKAEPAIAAELPDRIDELDHCVMTPEQIGLYQAVLDTLVRESSASDAGPARKGAVLAAITALKQICNHPLNYRGDEDGVEGRSGKLSRLNEIVDNVFAADERVLIFTHFASWGETLAQYLSERTGLEISCYHGGLGRTARDRLVDTFQKGTGPGAMVLSLKAGGTGLNLTAANHVVLYDRWWNPAVEDQARDRVWRIGQKNTVICHRLVCPGTVDERVEEVVAGKRKIADLVLPKSSSVGDLDSNQIQAALGIDPDAVMTEEVSVKSAKQPEPAQKQSESAQEVEV